MRHISRIVAISLLVALVPSISAAKGKPPPAPEFVDCDAGDSINAALDAAVSGEPLIINITGTCNENVTITHSQVTLQGVDPATSIIVGQAEGGLNALDPIDVGPVVLNDVGAVVIDNLTIREGESSGLSLMNSQAVITNCVIENNGYSGVYLVSGSHATIDSCTIQNNTTNGVIAVGNATAYVTNSTLSGNGNHGASAYGSSFIQIGQDQAGVSGPCTIAGNAFDGARAGESSALDVFNSTISANGHSGIRIFGASRTYLKNNKIDGNITAGSGEAGLGVYEGSSADLDDNEITNHPNGFGILAIHNAYVGMRNTLIDKAGANFPYAANIGIYRTSTLRMRGGNTLTNGDWAAIDFEQNSFLRASGGAGEIITAVGNSSFNGEPRLALYVYNAGYVDIRDNSTVTGDVYVDVLSTFRMRNNTLNGHVDIYGNSGLGIRDSVAGPYSVSCGPGVFEFNNGTPKC